MNLRKVMTPAAITVALKSDTKEGIIEELVDLLMGLRTSDEEERIGLDLTEHREASYTMID